jgi:hypothetical protein
MIISGTVIQAALGYEVKAMVIDLLVAYWKYLYIRQFNQVSPLNERSCAAIPPRSLQQLSACRRHMLSCEQHSPVSLGQ